MRFGVLGAGFLALILATDAGAAQAAEWRYCLALARAEPKVYMSYPFQSAIDFRKLEEMFRYALARAAFSVDSVQCPRGSDERSILAMRAHAVAFNRQMQITAVDVKWIP